MRALGDPTPGVTPQVSFPIVLRRRQAQRVGSVYEAPCEQTQAGVYSQKIWLHIPAPPTLEPQLSGHRCPVPKQGLRGGQCSAPHRKGSVDLSHISAGIWEIAPTPLEGS